MGRRPDRPEVQAAKGHPGKRKSKVEKQLEEAQRLAGLMAAAPSEGDGTLAPPAFLDERFAAALKVWKDYAPRLAKLQLLEPLDRYSFALFCVYYGEWVTANEDIQANGYSRLVTTVSGDKMPRVNPSVTRRKIAFDALSSLMPAFGLTPLDRFKLYGHQAAAPLGPLFDRKGEGGEKKPEAPPPGGGAGGEEGGEDDPIGIMARFDSEPPSGRPN